MKIISVVGARPNFMKVAPLHRVFSQESNMESVIVHTGQHYDERMSQIFFDQLGLPKPHHFLGVGGGSHTGQTARIMLAFEKILDDEQPDLVIVVGDVNSTVACALTAVKKQITVAHVEAGLRSGDRKMPEEINRVVTDAISDLLFVSERDGLNNLLAEGIDRDKIHFVGNIMIDSLVHFLPQADQLDVGQILRENQLATPDSGLPAPDFQLPTSDFPLPTPHSPLPTPDSPLPTSDSRLPTPHSPLPTPAYCLMTMHRPSNVDHKEGLNRILNIVRQISSEVMVVFAVHPRTKKNLHKYNLWEKLEDLDQVILTHPLSYLDFLKLMKEARLVITDSGGIQEETTYLKVPCITFRSSTERPSTVSIGSNTLIDELDIEKVLRVSEKYLAGRPVIASFAPPNSGAEDKSGFSIPELWDGQTAGRILEILKR